MGYCYRQLTSSDVPSLKELLNVFGEAFNEPETYQSNAPSDTYLKRLLKGETFILLVAQYDNNIVGGLGGYVLEKFEQERKEIYIYDLALLKKHRRMGIAT
jgi:aminoglycoside 3-N-acetyltransferase I